MIGLLLFVALAALMTLLGAWVYAARPSDTLNRLLAVALVLYGGSFLVFHFYRTQQLSVASQPYLETIFIFEVPALVLVLFALDRLFLSQPRTRVRSAVLWGSAALGGFMVVSLQAWPWLWYRSLREGPLDLVTGFTLSDLYGVASYLVVAWAVYLGARVAGNQEKRPIQRRQAAMVAISFGFLAAHTAGLALSGLTTDPSRVLQVHNLPAWIASLAGIVPLVYALVHVPGTFRNRGWPTVALIAPLLAGYLDNAVGGLFAITGLQAGFVVGNSRPLWLVGFALGLALAVVRYGLAGFGEAGRDRLARTAVPLSLVVLGIGGLAASLLSLGPTVPGLAVGLLALAAPVGLTKLLAGTWSRRLVDRALLDQEDPVVLEERVRLYSAALRGALDGQPVPAGRRAQRLTTLREELGLTERDHAVLAALQAPEVVETPPDRVLGRYVVEEEIGRGGTSRVFRARDAITGRQVVLKQVLVPGGMSQPVLREIQALAQLDHPHVLALHDAVDDENGLLLVLEHAPGGSLADRLARDGPLPAGEAIGLVLQVACGLEAVHQAGLVHGDVKAENVLLSASGTCKLADFGSARTVTRDPEVTVTLTASGASLCAMAPEQVLGKGPTARTDVYALGTLLFRLLTGEHYLDLVGRSQRDAQQEILESSPRLPHPLVPGPLSTVLTRMLSKEQDRRPADMATVRAVLDACVPEAADRPSQAAEELTAP